MGIGHDDVAHVDAGYTGPCSGKCSIQLQVNKDSHPVSEGHSILPRTAAAAEATYPLCSAASWRRFLLRMITGAANSRIRASSRRLRDVAGTMISVPTFDSVPLPMVTIDAPSSMSVL